MKSRSRRLFLILSAMAILLGGCESTGGDALFLSSEGRADDVYYAESPPRQTPEKELSECLLRVARQVAMREGVRVRHVSRPETVAGENYEKKTTELSYEQGNAIALLDRMTVLRVESDGAGTRALVRVSGSPRLAATLPSGGSGRPRWVDDPPKGSRFRSAVGTVSQIGVPADAFQNADIAAIGAIAEEVLSPRREGNAAVYEGTLRGVFIARRWRDSDGRSYSLAIIPR